MAAVFLVGCAVGGASARFVVPPASAQQAATLTKWEYTCVTSQGLITPEQANPLGAQGWELAVVEIPGLWCFKRPKL